MNPTLLLIFATGLTWPPTLPDDAEVGTGTSPVLLQPTDTLVDGVAIAETPPKVDFLYYDCQTYEPTKGPWSNWGDGLVVGDIYYSAVGDHDAPGGNAFVYAYDSNQKQLRKLLDLRSILQQPDGHYTPGKIHSTLGLGKDGWLYFSTHRGSTRIAFDSDAHFAGDWIVRHNPESGESEIVAHAPLPMQCMPTGMIDPDRLLFFAGTADGFNEKEPQFLAYDLEGREVVLSDPKGPARAMIFAGSTGNLYFHPEKNGAAQLLRFDPNAPSRLTPIDAAVGLRCASQESTSGMVYTIDRNQMWSFNCKTETAQEVGAVVAGSKDYITSVDLDSKTERYLYYVPGAHGGAEKDGSPLVQYDLKTNTRKVICFLHPYLYERFGYIPQGTYSTAVSPEGDKVYITWNGNRGTTPEQLTDPKARIRFNTCALTVVHIPETERLDDP